jgi:hypothetical protein
LTAGPSPGEDAVRAGYPGCAHPNDGATIMTTLREFLQINAGTLAGAAMKLLGIKA